MFVICIIFSPLLQLEVLWSSQVWFAIGLIDRVPVEVVQEYLGHADISTTRAVYASVIGKNFVREWLDILEGPLERAAKLKEGA